MKNKVLVELIVPDLDQKYDVYLPVNKKVGNVIILLNRAINEFSNGVFDIKQQLALYSGKDGSRYDIDEILRKTDIRSGVRLILM